MFLSNSDRLGEAEILLEGSIARAEAKDLPRAAARALNNLSVVYESADRFAEALETTSPALVHAARAGDRAWELLLRAGTVSSLILIGRWNEAVEIANELAVLPQSSLVANMTVHALEVDCWRGDVERAKARLEAAIDDETDDPQNRAIQALHEAIVLRTDGNPKAALEKLQLALESRKRHGIRFLIVKLAIVEELECAAALGDTTRVERILASIDELRPGERPPLLSAHAGRFRARLAIDPSDVERELRRAEEIFREHDLVFWLAVTQLEHAEWLVAQGRPAEAQPLLGEAHEIFERLAATPWVHRAAKAGPGLRRVEAEALA
jgi:tetratricopeptide (TPR) repeat protein